MRHGIVARYVDGKVLKGFTEELFPSKASFHLELADSGDQQKIALAKLKAVYFVKSFEGERERRDLKKGERPGYGKKIRVVFKDGEEIVGYTSGYTPDRAAFYLFPVDPGSNNDRVLVVTRSTAQVEFVRG